MTLPLAAPDEPTSPRILIVRMTAFGDVVHGIPVACAFVAHFQMLSSAGSWKAEPATCWKVTPRSMN